MATNNNRNTTAKKSTSARSTSARNSSSGRSQSGRSASNTSAKNGSNRNNTRSRTPTPQPDPITGDLFLFLGIAICVVLFLCNFGIIGLFGKTVSDVMFGIFGLTAWILPLVSIVFILFGEFNRGNAVVTRKLIAGGFLCILVMIMCDLATGMISTDLPISIPGIYTRCAESHRGGGVVGGILAYYLEKLLGGVGTILLLIVLIIICLLIIAGRSLIAGLKEQGQLMYDETMEERRAKRLSREDVSRIRQEERAERIARKRELNDAREREKQIRAEEKENEQILRMDRKGKGVTFNTTLDPDLDKKAQEALERDDEHLIKVTDTDEYERRSAHSAVLHENLTAEGTDAIREITPVYDDEPEEDYGYDRNEPAYEPEPEPEYEPEPEPVHVRERERTVTREVETPPVKEKPVATTERRTTPSKGVKYKFPPISLLTPGSGANNRNGDRELKDTSDRLVQTLETFGVKVKITDVSRGPAVTRYELQPELGVKVSKIVGLSDQNRSTYPRKIRCRRRSSQ